MRSHSFCSYSLQNQTDRPESLTSTLGVSYHWRGQVCFFLRASFTCLTTKTELFHCSIVRYITRLSTPMTHFQNAALPTCVLALAQYISFWGQSEHLKCVCVLEIIREVLRSRLRRRNKRPRRSVWPVQGVWVARHIIYTPRHTQKNGMLGLLFWRSFSGLRRSSVILTFETLHQVWRWPFFNTSSDTCHVALHAPYFTLHLQWCRRKASFTSPNILASV